MQLSRWDRIKDMEGVLRAFAELLIDDPTDLAGFGAAINRLLADEALAAAMKGSDEAYHPPRTSDRRTSGRLRRFC